jgi:predicted esterase
MTRPDGNGALSRFLIVLVGLASTDCGGKSPERPDGGGAAELRVDLGARDGIGTREATPGGFRLTVASGHGSGVYPAGSTVHVWAAVDPLAQIVTGWNGDAALLKEPKEWHTTLTMPGRDVSLSAQLEPRSLALQTIEGTWSTATKKTAYVHVPAGAKGVVFFLHGTGGSSKFVTKAEAQSVALVAVKRGYGVISPEAEEVAAGDLDGNGKIRWSPQMKADNKDYANLEALLGELRAQGKLASTTPLYSLGMSNGGSMSVAIGAVAATPIAGSFPSLRFRAVVSFCASGAVALGGVTTTPTAWLMCAKDDNPEVSNAEAKQSHDALAARGIDTIYDEHPPSPLYDERFLRAGLDLATSKAVAKELRAAGAVDGAGFFVRPGNDLAAEVQAQPASYPSLTAVPPAGRLEVLGQISVMEAEHAMYADWASRAIEFFEKHP